MKLAILLLLLLLIKVLKGQDNNPPPPVTSDVLSSSMSNGQSNPNYIIDYFEISAGETIVNAYPLNECTLISLINKYKYSTFTCDALTGNTIIIQEFYEASDCSSGSNNSTLRRLISIDNTLDVGDVGTFNCNGEDNFIRANTCNDQSSSNNYGDLCIVPDVCYYDISGSSITGNNVAFKWSCITKDGNDIIQLNSYNIAQDASRSCDDQNTNALKSSSQLSTTANTCTNIYSDNSGNSLKAIIDSGDAVCTWVNVNTQTTGGPGGPPATSPGGQNNSTHYILHFNYIIFISFIIIISLFFITL
jgi:hypothetical protein